MRHTPPTARKPQCLACESASDEETYSNEEHTILVLTFLETRRRLGEPPFVCEEHRAIIERAKEIARMDRADDEHGGQLPN